MTAEADSTPLHGLLLHVHCMIGPWSVFFGGIYINTVKYSKINSNINTDTIQRDNGSAMLYIKIFFNELVIYLI